MNKSGREEVSQQPSSHKMQIPPPPQPRQHLPPSDDVCYGITARCLCNGVRLESPGISRVSAWLLIRVTSPRGAEWSGDSSVDFPANNVTHSGEPISATCQ